MIPPLWPLFHDASSMTPPPRFLSDDSSLGSRACAISLDSYQVDLVESVQKHLWACHILYANTGPHSSVDPALKVIAGMNGVCDAGIEPACGVAGEHIWFGCMVPVRREVPCSMIRDPRARMQDPEPRGGILGPGFMIPGARYGSQKLASR